MKIPLTGNMNVRLRMYQGLLFKFRRHLCKGSKSTSKILAKRPFLKTGNHGAFLGEICGEFQCNKQVPVKFSKAPEHVSDNILLAITKLLVLGYSSLPLISIHLLWSRPTYAREIENATITGHLRFVFEENSVRKITWLSWRHGVRKILFSKGFQFTFWNAKPVISNSSVFYTDHIR